MRFLSLMSLSVSVGFLGELRRLNLLQFFGPQIDDYSSLSLFHRSLEKLCVCFAKAMSSACFADSTQIWSNLSVLSLNGCAKINDDALKDISAVCPSLQTG